MCLSDDGTIYRATWQWVTDRSDSVSSGSDQWIAPSRSTRLAALWVQVQSYKEMSLSDEIRLVWDDAMEMPPGFDTTQEKDTKKTDSASMPPPKPKQKMAPSKTPSSDPAASTAGAGVCPAPDSETSEVSSLAEEQGQGSFARHLE